MVGFAVRRMQFNPQMNPVAAGDVVSVDWLDQWNQFMQGLDGIMLALGTAKGKEIEAKLGKLRYFRHYRRLMAGPAQSASIRLQGT